MTAFPEKLLLASPRGYCAGVDRAVQTVERALDLYGAPVYVRKEIVHNKHVVEELRTRGAVFVDSETEVPEGATVVFSAHGVAPGVHANARARGLRTIDATCPLVTKVHVEAKKFAADGYTIVLVGHNGHEEVEGTMGEAPEHIVLIETVEDVDQLEVEDPTRVAYISQTTLSVDETKAIINRLRERFPAIVGPRTDDICYATTNRQAAVKQLARRCDLVLVIGSTNSSNSNRLVEVAREHGAAAHLIDNELHVEEDWLTGMRVVGVTSGASAPEQLVQRLVEFFRARGTSDVQELEVIQEDVRFMLPQGDPQSDGDSVGGRRPLRTLVVSDLHLGARTGVDVLRYADRRAALAAALPGCDRFVLLGDTLELRHGPIREALAAAEPVMRELARALDPGAEVIIVPGNHDHRLLRSWLERRAAEPGPSALGLQTPVDWREHEPLAELASWLAPAEVRAAYPGVWLREGVYATHGHYGDLHTTVPILERLGAALMMRVGRGLDGGPSRAEDYEAVLGPMYAWVDGIAQSGGLRGGGGGGLQVRAWRSIQHSGARLSIRGAGAATGFAAAVAMLNRAGLGPFGADVSGPELRRAALRAFSEVVERLGVGADVVISGHTHRAGPLPGDARSEWLAPRGSALLNVGSWVYEREFLGDSPGSSPYRPGFCAVVQDGERARLVNLLDPA